MNKIDIFIIEWSLSQNFDDVYPTTYCSYRIQIGLNKSFNLALNA